MIRCQNTTMNQQQYQLGEWVAFHDSVVLVPSRESAATRLAATTFEIMFRKQSEQPLESFGVSNLSHTISIRDVQFSTH